MKKYVRIIFFCGIVMPSQENNISQFNQYMKSDKMSYIIYADIEFLIKKMYGYAKNPENSSATKIGEHIYCQCSVSTV